jgi:hypothetical protein
LVRTKLAMRRSGFVENRPNAMSCNKFGWILVAHNMIDPELDGTES